MTDTDRALPRSFNFARDVVDRFAVAEADRPALLYRDGAGDTTRFTFAEMSEAIHRFASVLAALEVRPGEPVMVLLPPIPAWQIAVIGTMAAGAIAVPTSIAVLGPQDIRHRARHSESVVVVTHAAYASLIDEMAPALPALRHRILVREHANDAHASGPWIDFDEQLAAGDPHHAPLDTLLSDPALVLYTSGTTGPPKAVLHDHGYPFAAGRQAAYWHGLRPSDRFWPTTGWAKAAFVPWSCGAEIVVCRERFAGREQVDALVELAPDVFCAPPTQYRTLLTEDLSRLRATPLRECVAAGEPLNPEVIEGWRAQTGLRIRDGYGQSEAGLLMANPAGAAERIGTMGRPMPGLTIEILDDAGNLCAAGVEGDLAVRRPVPGLFREYWKDPVATAKALGGEWYRTGDRAFRDTEGDFWFVGRSDDVILSGSHRIGPFEVESRLLEHPDVVEAAAVAIPDATRGQAIKAWIVLRDGATESAALVAELSALFAETERERCPREFAFVEALPKTATGKLLRKQLRERSTLA